MGISRACAWVWIRCLRANNTEHASAAGVRMVPRPEPNEIVVVRGEKVQVTIKIKSGRKIAS